MWTSALQLCVAVFALITITIVVAEDPSAVVQERVEERLNTPITSEEEWKDLVWTRPVPDETALIMESDDPTKPKLDAKSEAEIKKLKGQPESVIDTAVAAATVEEDQDALKLTEVKHALTVDSGMMSIAVLKAKMQLAANPGDKNSEAANQAKKLAQDVVDGTKAVKTAQSNEAAAKLKITSLTALLTPNVAVAATPDDLDDTLKKADKTLENAKSPVDDTLTKNDKTLEDATSTVDTEKSEDPDVTMSSATSPASPTVDDKLNQHLQAQMDKYKAKLDDDKAAVVGAKAQVNTLKAKAAQYTANLDKTTKAVEEAQNHMKHSVDKLAYQEKLYQDFKTREDHHKKVEEVKRRVALHRQNMEIQQEEVLSTKEKLHKAVVDQKELTASGAAASAAASAADTPNSASQSKLEGAIAAGLKGAGEKAPMVTDAVKAVSKSLDSNMIEAQLKPQMARLKIQYAHDPAGLKRAIDALIDSVVATKVDHAMMHPSVQNAIKKHHSPEQASPATLPASPTAATAGVDAEGTPHAKETEKATSKSQKSMELTGITKPEKSKKPKKKEEEGIIGEIEEGFGDVEKALGFGRR